MGLSNAVATAKIWLAAPVTGSPSAPDGLTTKTDSLWSNGLFIFAIAATFGMLVALGSVLYDRQQGRSANWGQVGVILAACCGVGIVPAIVGGITGT